MEYETYNYYSRFFLFTPLVELINPFYLIVYGTEYTQQLGVPAITS